jgi:hypothetical protein
MLLKNKLFIEMMRVLTVDTCLPAAHSGAHPGQGKHPMKMSAKIALAEFRYASDTSE